MYVYVYLHLSKTSIYIYIYIYQVSGSLPPKYCVENWLQRVLLLCVLHRMILEYIMSYYNTGPYNIL